MLMFKIVPAFRLIRVGKNWAGEVGVYATKKEAKEVMEKLI